MRVAELPCCVCGSEPVQVHHIIGVGLSGAGMRSSDWFTLPLCYSHHSELHNGGIRTWEQKYGIQARFVELTLEELYG